MDGSVGSFAGSSHKLGLPRGDLPIASNGLRGQELLEIPLQADSSDQSTHFNIGPIGQ